MEPIYYTLNPWWEGRDFDSGIERSEFLVDVRQRLTRKQIEVFIGSRRIGKTTLFKQFIKQLLKEGVHPQEILYLALDHPALSSVTISDHLRGMRKLFMHGREKRLFLFLDEVQESPGWEIELKSLYDLEDLKVFCTGSTSSLIKRQGGRLTGRQITMTLAPLSFKEFLLFQGAEPSLSEDYKYEKLVEDYLSIGGYPENVLNPSAEYLSNLLEDILARDLVRLYPIKKAFVLKDLMRLVAASVGSRTSFNKLARVLKLAVDTIKEYIQYLESAFLVATLEKWTSSYTERVYSQKKIYLQDTGMKTLITGPGDMGHKAENAVFMELRRRELACGYFAESEKEVDFVVDTSNGPVPVEVKYISHFDWNDRFLSGLKLFMRRNPGIRRALLITKDVDQRVAVDNVELTIAPLWKFLLQSNSFLAP